MYDTCLACGHYCPENGFEQDHDDLVCDACGHRHPLNKLPLYVVLGPPGTGKSTLCNQVLRMPDRPDMVYMESDYFLVLSRDGWQSVVNYMLLMGGVVGRSGRSVVLFSGGDPAQFEGSGDRWRVGEIHYLILTCDPSLQEERLRSRPEWRTSGHTEASIQGWIDWTQLLIREADTASPPYQLLNAGTMDREECARALFDWIRGTEASRSAVG